MPGETGESIMVLSKTRGWLVLAVPGIAVLLMVAFVGLGSASAATTHYIAAAGSDAANGTSTSTPWAHLPGMPNCTNNCASYSPSAGDRFIFKGGDTWGAASLGIDWEWDGTSGAPIYVGVDPAYFTGASWTRPIFNCQNTSCSKATFGNIIWIAGDYVTFDNIEFTGYQQSGGGNLIGVYGNNDEIEHFYMHGWSRTAGSGGSNSFAVSNNWSGGGARGTRVHDNVIDGSDSPNKDFMGGVLHGDMVYNNVIRYVYNGMNGLFNDVHGNLVEHNYVSTSGDHCNMVFVQAVFTGTKLSMYNNVVRNAGCAGGMTFWMLGNTGCSGCTSYAYNNLIYGNGMDSDKGISIGSHPSDGTTGTYYIYNNTIDPEGGSCMGNGEPSPRSTTHYANNHCINSSTICDGTGTTCSNDGGNLTQTLAQASADSSPHLDQYTSSETYPFSPIASTNSTVGAATNLTALCSGNLAALCNDSSYANYDTVNHRVVMRAAVTRPATGAWDIGAYQFSTSQVPVPPPPSLPAPPTNLTGVIH
jgi:hypothetical protein